MSLDILPKKEIQTDMCVKGVISTQIVDVYHYYVTMRCKRCPHLTQFSDIQVLKMTRVSGRVLP